MQNRYVGDIGDYVKLAILRCLARDRFLGVAWWLFPDEAHNRDGRHREYLERPDEWRRFDSELFDALLKINAGERPNVGSIESAGLFAKAAFASDEIPCSAKPYALRQAARLQWLANVTKQLKDCDLLFIDPDNGIAPRGLRKTRRKAGKSVFIDEIAALRETKRSILVYHHQSMRRGGHEKEFRHLSDLLKSSGLRVSGVLRAKPWSPRVFFLIDGEKVLCERAAQIAVKWNGLISWHPVQ